MIGTYTIDQLRTAKANVAQLSLDEVGTLLFALDYVKECESDGEDGIRERYDQAREAQNVLLGRPRSF
jgi:hypothetical protein